MAHHVAVSRGTLAAPATGSARVQGIADPAQHVLSAPQRAHRVTLTAPATAALDTIDTLSDLRVVLTSYVEQSLASHAHGGCSASTLASLISSATQLLATLRCLDKVVRPPSYLEASKVALVMPMPGSAAALRSSATPARAWHLPARAWHLRTPARLPLLRHSPLLLPPEVVYVEERTIFEVESLGNLNVLTSLEVENMRWRLPSHSTTESG
jgi:hypothetical protein